MEHREVYIINILSYMALFEIEYYISFPFLLGNNSWQSQNWKTFVFCIISPDDKVNFPEDKAISFFLPIKNIV